MDVILRGGRRPSTRRRGILRWAALALGTLVVAGTWAWVSVEPGAPATPGTTGPRPPAAHAGAAGTKTTVHKAADPVPLGVYAGPGARAASIAVDRQLDGRVRYALDFLAETSWATITQPAWLAAAWRGSSFRMILGVPMLPASGATLAEGAAGAFDGEYALLARRLVADGFGTAVLMIGWQPDDKGYPWYVASVATAGDYVRYWDRIRTTMAAVPGAHFTYEWDAGDGATSPVSPAAMYPGNAAVDVVATDAFDHLDTPAPDATRWQALLGQRDGPAWTAAFAAAHGKPLAIAMWGEMPVRVGGGGDDPAFVRALLSWASATGVRMCVLWDYGSWTLTGGAFPAAEAALVGIVDAPPAPAPSGGGPATTP